MDGTINGQVPGCPSSCSLGMRDVCPLAKTPSHYQERTQFRGWLM